MKVKYLEGENPIYTVVLPEYKEIKDLPTNIKNSIAKLNLDEEKYDIKDLSNETDEWSLTIIKQIQETGASLMKLNYVGQCLSGKIYFTFPPFSVLDQI